MRVVVYCTSYLIERHQRLRLESRARRVSFFLCTIFPYGQNVNRIKKKDVAEYKVEIAQRQLNIDGVSTVCCLSIVHNPTTRRVGGDDVRSNERNGWDVTGSIRKCHIKEVEEEETERERDAWKYKQFFKYIYKIESKFEKKGKKSSHELRLAFLIVVEQRNSKHFSTRLDITASPLPRYRTAPVSYQWIYEITHSNAYPLPWFHSSINPPPNSPYGFY